MKQFIYAVLTGLLLVSITACEDFLQKDPPSSPSQVSFWKSKADFESALASCYSVVYDSPGVLSQVLSTLDNLTDNSFCQFDETNYGRTKTMQQGEINPNIDGYPRQLYTLVYKGVGRVHQVMSKLEEYQGSDISADDRKFMLAQCKALRGYLYHYMYMCYREFPLVTELLGMDNMYQPKALRAAIYTQLMKDFDEAIAELPDLQYSDARVSGRFTASAVKILKARIMMFEAYGDKGTPDVAKMKEVIPILESIKGYRLADNFRQNFVSEEQLGSPELIFTVRYLEPNRRNNIELFFGAWQANMPSRDLVNAFECTDGLEWGDSPLTIAVDETIINTKDPALADEQKAERTKLFINRDKRLSQSIFHSAILKYPEEGYPEIALGAGNASLTGFGMLKLLQPREDHPEAGVQKDADVVIMRYGHVLLMIAEAENEVNGPTKKAYDAVNAIRTRSGQPTLPANLTQEEMRQRIRKEWRVETCFEGLHYFHLKQWKEMDRLNGFTDPMYKADLYFEPAFYFWPLPQSEIDRAAGILEQDANYI